MNDYDRWYRNYRRRERLHNVLLPLAVGFMVGFLGLLFVSGVIVVLG